MNIKFRAWHKELKIMRQVHMLDRIGSDYMEIGVSWCENEKNYNFCGDKKCTGDCGREFIIREKEVIWELYEIELMQWTGLQDICGQDVYVGDILEFNQEDYRFVEYGDVVIEYDPKRDGIHARYLRDNEWDNLHTIRIHECTILGNIYENGDLIPSSPNEEPDN